MPDNPRLGLGGDTAAVASTSMSMVALVRCCCCRSSGLGETDCRPTVDDFDADDEAGTTALNFLVPVAEVAPSDRTENTATF